VGSKGDSMIMLVRGKPDSLYKRELIDPKNDLQGVDDVMLATNGLGAGYNEDRNPFI